MTFEGWAMADSSEAKLPHYLIRHATLPLANRIQL
jgi:hypothetical protein